MHEIYKDKASTQKDSGPLIFLSLFLLLLAFFILLNALATIEETKSRRVLTSVAATFRSVADVKTTAQILVADLGKTPEPQELLDAMERLWVTAIPVVDVDQVTPGEIMQMAFPANELFVGGKADMRTDRRQLLEAVARVLAVPAKGSASELQLVLGSDPVSQSQLLAAGNLPMRRATTLADALVALGAPADTISVGIREGKPKSMRMRFAVRDAGRAHVTFQGLSPQ